MNPLLRWLIRRWCIHAHRVDPERDERTRANQIAVERVIGKAVRAQAGLCATVAQMHLLALIARDEARMQVMRDQLRRDNEWAEIQKRLRGGA